MNEAGCSSEQLAVFARSLTPATANISRASWRLFCAYALTLTPSILLPAWPRSTVRLPTRHGVPLHVAQAIHALIEGAWNQEITLEGLAQTQLETFKIYAQSINGVHGECRIPRRKPALHNEHERAQLKPEYLAIDEVIAEPIRVLLEWRLAREVLVPTLAALWGYSLTGPFIPFAAHQLGEIMRAHKLDANEARANRRQRMHTQYQERVGDVIKLDPEAQAQLDDPETPREIKNSIRGRLNWLRRKARYDAIEATHGIAKPDDEVVDDDDSDDDDED